MTSYASMVLGGEDRNVEQLGAYVAWLINHQLFQDHVERSAGSALTRVRMQDLNGGDFLSLALHGELEAAHLTDQGRAFTEHYLLSGRYDKDYATVKFDGENEWQRYADLAPLITRAFREFEDGKKPKGMLAKVLQFPGRKA